jgi:hypothetical protein
VQGETMLRVANVRSEAVLEGVRDALDLLGVDYEHIRSEPGEDAYPQTAYFYVPDGSADEVDNAMQRLSEEHGFDAELL